MHSNTQAKFDLAFEVIKELEKKAQWFINKNPHKINDMDFIKNTKNIEALSDFYNHMIELIEQKEKLLTEHEKYIKHLQKQIEHFINCAIIEDPQHAHSTMFYYQSFSPEQLKKLMMIKKQVLTEIYREEPFDEKLFLATSVNTINKLYKHENYNEENY